MSWILGIDAVCRVSRLNIIALIFVFDSSVCVWEGGGEILNIYVLVLAYTKKEVTD